MRTTLHKLTGRVQQVSFVRERVLESKGNQEMKKMKGLLFLGLFVICLQLSEGFIPGSLRAAREEALVKDFGQAR